MKWLLKLLFKRKRKKRLDKSVTLIEHYLDEKRMFIYSVNKIKNSTELYLDQEFTKKQVNKLIRKGWRVTISNEQVR